MAHLFCTPILYPMVKPQGDSFSKLKGCIFKNKDGVLSILHDEEDILKSMQWFGAVPQHLYFISEERKNEGDKCICLDEVRSNLLPENENMQVSPFIRWMNTNHCGGCRKIEATTDPSLDLPLIPQSFIEGFVHVKGKIQEVQLDELILFQNEFFYDDKRK